MVLSADLLQEFAAMVTPTDDSVKETNVYGTAKVENGEVTVRIDGSDIYTPVELAVNVNDGDRVLVQLKNRNAIVTGNLTSSGGSTVISYVSLVDKPSIEGVTLTGNKTFEELNLQSLTNSELESMLT